MLHFFIVVEVYKTHQTLQRFLNRRRNVNVPTFFGQLFKKPIQKFADFNAAKNRNHKIIRTNFV